MELLGCLSDQDIYLVSFALGLVYLYNVALLLFVRGVLPQ